MHKDADTAAVADAPISYLLMKTVARPRDITEHINAENLLGAANDASLLARLAHELKNRKAQPPKEAPPPIEALADTELAALVQNAYDQLTAGRWIFLANTATCLTQKLRHLHQQTT